MTCPRCRPWAAKTREQLDNRKRNVVENPNVTTHLCPICLTDDWALTDEMIPAEPVTMPTMWQRLIKLLMENQKLWRKL